MILAEGKLNQLRVLTLLPSLQGRIVEDIKVVEAVLKDCQACLKARFTEFEMYGQYNGLVEGICCMRQRVILAGFH